MYVREGLGKQWYETLLDVAGEAGATVTEAYGGKMAGDAVRAGHKIWTGLAFKDNKGGGAPARPPPPPRLVRSASGQILGPPSGPPGSMPPPPPPWKPRPRKKKIAMMQKVLNMAPVQGPSSGPAAAPVETGGGSSKGMLIFGVVSAVAVGLYLVMQPKKPTTPPHDQPRP